MLVFNKRKIFSTKIFTTAVLMMMLTWASAQKIDSTVTVVENPSRYKVVTNPFWDNWFAGLGLGAQLYFGDHNKQMKLGDRFTPSFDGFVGKWFTPGVGLRLAVNGSRIKGVSGWSGHSNAQPNVNYGNYQGFITGAKFDANGKFLSGDVYGKEESGAYDLYKYEISYLHTHADVLFNMNNLLGGYKRDRVYSFIPYAGLGWMNSFNRDISGKKSHEVSASIGLLNNFRISPAVDFNVDVRGAFVNERFDGQHGNRWGEGLLSGTVGLTYKFKKRGWDRSRNTVIRYKVDDSYYREKIQELESENMSLKAKLGTDARGAQIIEKTLVAVPQLVIFPIDKWTLSKEARVNLGFLAKIMKEMNAQSPATYLITGYADKGTGTVERNQRLSRERAQAVYHCLVNEFGIPPRLLKTRFLGGVDDMFYSDPRLSRCAIVTAE